MKESPFHGLGFGKSNVAALHPRYVKCSHLMLMQKYQHALDSCRNK
jgi:hypothetical protein